MKLINGLQGYKSFLVNTLTALFNVLLVFNIELTPENLQSVMVGLIAVQSLIAHVMRLLTKTPPGKDIEDVRESVVVGDQTKTDDLLGGLDDS